MHAPSRAALQRVMLMSFIRGTGDGGCVAKCWYSMDSLRCVARFASTLGPLDGAASAKPSSITGASAPSDQRPSHSHNPADAMQSKVPAFGMQELLEEIQCLVVRPLPIGDLFRLLSPAARKTLAANKMPLEQLLLHYPANFVVFRVGNGIGPKKVATINVAPPHLVPEGVRVLRLPVGQSMGVNSTSGISLPTLQAGSSAGRSASIDGKGAVAIDHRAGEGDFDAGIMTTQQRMQMVLRYIPNEWSSFVDLKIPYEVKLKCMGYPSIKPKEFFARYPQYFDVRMQRIQDPSFYVRRSLTLQQRIAEENGKMH